MREDKEFQEFKYLKLEGENKNKVDKIWYRTQNWFDKNWWSYGYDKELILRNTFYIFLGFFFFNLFFLNPLCNKIYTNTVVKQNLNNPYDNKLMNFIIRILLSFYYTSLIFFIIGFKVDNVVFFKYIREKDNNPNSFDNPILKILKSIMLGVFLIEVTLMYLSGLVCLGYLANFVITGGK